MLWRYAEYLDDATRQAASEQLTLASFFDRDLALTSFDLHPTDVDDS